MPRSWSPVWFGRTRLQFPVKKGCPVLLGIMGRSLHDDGVSWVAAGPAAELEPLLAKLRAEEVFVRELDTLGIAYHSPGLRAYAEDLAAGLGPPLSFPRGVCTASKSYVAAAPGSLPAKQGDSQYTCRFVQH